MSESQHQTSVDSAEPGADAGLNGGTTNGHEPVEEDDRHVQSVDREQPPRLPYTVVGMGASAGGVEALSAFFDALPPATGMAFVVVQHLPPERESLMAEILSKHTRMPVRQVEDGMLVHRNHVYVIRPGNTLTIRFGKLHLGEPLEARGHQRPVDDFFRSLAEEQRERAVCVILSGMGSNGTAGAQMVKAVGGVCVAQDPDTAAFPSMPRSLIDSGLSDFVLRPADMPEALARYAEHPYAKGDRSVDEIARRDRKVLGDVLTALRTRTRHDFTGYKTPTIVRRVQRRMGLNQVAELSEYAQLLRTRPAEATALADDMMIHVTGFFRDPDAWDALRERVIAPLVASRPDDGSIRCWVTACSSGEEAYTLAILLVEAAEAAGKRFDIKVFATDMAERSLARARAGIYPGGIESEVAPERLARFFEREDVNYRVRRDVRELIVFAPQNVLHDPPFSRMDICSCRNLLIYLEPAVQRRVMQMLHFGLTEGGALFLGTSETNAGADDLFEPIDKRARLFRRVGPTRHGAVEFRTPRALPLGGTTGLAPAERGNGGGAPRVSLAQLTQRTLLEQFTPAAVVVDRDLRIVYYHGRTEPFLTQPRGEPTRELMALLRDGVRGPVRSVLHAAVERHETGTARDGVILTDDGPRQLAVRAVPLQPSPHSAYFLVSFDLSPAPSTAPMLGPATAADHARDATLEEELARARDDLQATVEALQATNEEMRASNEEVTSVNEELQSTNEELETSKEEMQSLNEELTTVNAQLQAKMDELQAATNDLTSLLSSTSIAVIFLDTGFRIRRFTPAVAELIDLIGADVGRPLVDMNRKFDDPALLDDAQAVLAKLVPAEREVSGVTGRTYVRRVLPYRTTDNRIDGVVITFVDISARKAAEDALRASEEQLRRVIAVDTVGILFLTDDGRVTDANDAFLRLTGRTRGELAGGGLTWDRFVPDGGDGAMDRMRATGRLTAHEAECARADGHRWWGLFTAARLADGSHVAFVVDVTERRRAVADLAESERRFRALADVVPDLLWRTDTTGVTDWYNRQWLDYTGQSIEQAKRNGWTEVIHPDDREASRERYEQSIRSGQPFRQEHRIRRRDGQYRWFRVDARLVRDAGGTPVEWFGAATDVHDERTALETLRESADRIQLAAGTARIGFWDSDVAAGTVVGDPQHNRILGLPVEPAKMPLHRVLAQAHPDDRQRVADSLAEAAGRAGDFSIQFRVNWPDGTTRSVVKHGRPLFDAGALRARRMIGTLLDVTDRVRAEAERDRLIDEALLGRRDAEAANEAKDQFLANVSHELRTPLSAILLWAKMLRASGAAPPEQRQEGLETIARAAESQRELIEDLLDTSRIVSGKLRLDVRAVDLPTLVREAVEIARPAATAKRVELAVDVHAEDDGVRADPDRLRQVLWNLLNNAVKFTPAGGRVDISTRRTGDEVEVIVTDTGRGIAADQLPHVFERFWQAESAARQTKGGLGLGLPIAKQLVELHGGTIEVHSDGPGQGSRFHIRLPLPLVQRTGKANGRAADAGPKLVDVRVLLVEDDAATRDGLVAVLRAAGATVVPVGTQADAIDAFRAARPDVILSDIGLPDGDGNDLIRQVRTLEADGKLPATPAIALTALTRRQDRRRTAESGFQQHMAKPVDPDRLVRALWALLEQ
jgi:two-component system CheB/CheR fusion protein